jgi:putative tryptophan/tyrosine transport system substrate-binding protein
MRALVPLALLLLAGPALAEPVTIYMITWRGPTETDRGFVEHLERQGLEARFVVRDAERDPARILGFVEEIRELRPDLVYTWGGAAPPHVVGRFDSVDPERHVTDIPVVTCMVADPVELGVTPDWAGSGRNVTGTSHVAPLEVQLRGMQAYLPVARLAVIYNTTEPGPGIVVERMRALAGEMGYELLPLPVPLAGGEPDPASLPGLVAEARAAGADALYLGPDSFLGAHRHLVTESARDQGLPTFVSSEVYLHDGAALAGVVSPYYNIGAFCAHKAQEILNGRDPGTIPFETLERFSYLIDLEVARAVGVLPPLSLLTFAEIIGR